MPNSKRLFERWSSRATFSAMRTGLLTGGVMLKIAEPRCTRSVMPEQWPRNASGPGMWLYSSRKWCCGHHTYLKAFWSAALAISTLRMMRLCSALGSGVALELGDEQLGEDAELHGGLPPGRPIGTRTTVPEN